jgi:hypothetical protein
MSQSQSNHQDGVFDVITSGTGYLRRIRFVTRGTDGRTLRKPYLCCTINLMMGKVGTGPEDRTLQYLAYDCLVVGAVAKRVIRQLRPHVDAKPEKRVLVGARIGDAMPDPYWGKDSKTGEEKQFFPMKGRLLQVTFAKVDGTKIDIELVPRDTKVEVEDDEAQDPVAGQQDQKPGSDADKRSAKPVQQAARRKLPQDEEDGVGSACEDTSRPVSTTA